jgi:succinoglycan biosynthesis protein ExoA
MREMISIVVPVRNEAKFIGHCLKALLQQDYPKNLIEIICVDGMSDDGTRELIYSYSSADNRIRLLDNLQQTAPAAMNIGIRHAKGNIIVRVDARCIVEPDYVRQCVHYLELTGADNVGGRQSAVGDQSMLSEAIAFATTSPFGMGNSKFRYSNKEQYVDTVYLGAYPKQVFDRVGLYNEFLLRNQDYELNHRIRAAGGKIYFTPKIQSVYYGRPTLRSLWRQYFQYGYWKVRTIHLHPSSIKFRQLVAPLFVLTTLLALILGIIFSNLIPFFLISFVYISVMLATIYLQRSKQSLRTLLWLPIVFVFIHFGWGLGFIWGVLTLHLSPQVVPGAGYR